MPRTFNGTTDKLSVSLGAVPQLTAFTISVIANLTAGAETQVMVSVGANFAPEYYFGGSNQRIFNGTTDGVSAGLGKVTGWACYTVTKAAGTVKPRFHRYVYATDADSHSDAVATLADVTATPTTGIYLGYEPAASFFLPGDIAVASIWDVAMTDAQVELLPFRLMDWFSPAQPKALWTLDQGATTQKVLDWSGGGANELSLTGTAVATASLPIFDPVIRMAGAVL